MRANKKIAWLLSVALMVVTLVSQAAIPVKAAVESVDFQLSIAIDGDQGPQHYSVSYQVVDADGSNVDGDGYSGNISEASERNVERIQIADLDSTYKIKFEVVSAGWGIRLNGNDVTNEGWSDGKVVELSDLGSSYEFKLFSSNPGGNPGGEPFDGIAYFVWKGADDAVCVHKITGLENSRLPGEEIAFQIIYIPVTDITDDLTGEQYKIENRDYYWAWSQGEEFINANRQSYTKFATEAERLNPDEKRAVLIDPCGAKNGNSTVCTNGDRVFRATIFDATKFEGISFSDDAGDYTYFPQFWNKVLFSNTVDISNTTKENPANYETFLTEPSIKFGKTAGSVNEFTSIKALDVPDGAVTITGSAATGYEVTFGSNFFDNVVFEITTANEVYYVKIVRTAIKAFDDRSDDGQPQVVAEIYYDENESYNDYDVYATIHYEDGRVSMKKVAVSEITQDAFGNPMSGVYEMEGGQKLKCAQYKVTIGNDVVGVDFNAVKSGALSGDTFGGSYFGSGNGVYFDIEERSVIY